MSMARCAMTLRSFIGRGCMEDMGALTSPADMQIHLCVSIQLQGDLHALPQHTVEEIMRCDDESQGITT